MRSLVEVLRVCSKRPLKWQWGGRGVGVVFIDY